ncbi:MAG: hypothetical protein ABEJ99_00610 [Candidatus Nanohaloarchaea archaeon]
MRKLALTAAILLLIGGAAAAHGTDGRSTDLALYQSQNSNSPYTVIEGFFTGFRSKYINVYSPRYRGLELSYRNSTKKEIRLLENRADSIHRKIIGLVIDRNRLNETELEQLKNGDVILDTERKKIHLKRNQDKGLAGVESKAIPRKKLDGKDPKRGTDMTHLRSISRELGILAN